MKVLQVPFCYYPDPPGGTEVYVASLSQELKRCGIEVVIAAASSRDDAYDYESIRVRRYKVSSGPIPLYDLYGKGDNVAAQSFTRVLTTEQPDILHVHGFTSGISIRTLRAAKSMGIPVVFTYHTPTVTCQRGTMMRWGTEPCHGLMDLHTCARCSLDGLFNRPGKNGIWNILAKSTRTLSNLLGSLPPSLGTLLGELNFEGGSWTALRMTELVRLRHASVRSMFSEVDQIIAVCQWVKDVLTCNGVDPQKITLCRQGITDQRQTIALNQAQHGSSLNIAFLGRLDPTKGVHILIQALRSLLSDPFRLVIYGVVHGEPGQRYERELRRLAAGDERIEFHSPIRTAEVVSTLRDFDLVAVPSQWLETGPLVVLEAFSAGVPVIGSRLGSIAETVRDGVDGILVPATSVEAWAQALLRLNRDRGLVELLRRGVKPPRSMPVVANEMAALYAQVHEDNVEYRFSTAAKSR